MLAAAAAASHPACPAPTTITSYSSNIELFLNSIWQLFHVKHCNPQTTSINCFT
jgi:hypothetical protein